MVNRGYYKLMAAVLLQGVQDQDPKLITKGSGADERPGVKERIAEEAKRFVSHLPRKFRELSPADAMEARKSLMAESKR